MAFSCVCQLVWACWDVSIAMIDGGLGATAFAGAASGLDTGAGNVSILFYQYTTGLCTSVIYFFSNFQKIIR